MTDKLEEFLANLEAKAKAHVAIKEAPGLDDGSMQCDPDTIRLLLDIVRSAKELHGWAARIEPGATFEWHHSELFGSERIPMDITAQTFPPERGVIAKCGSALSALERHAGKVQA